LLTGIALTLGLIVAAFFIANTIDLASTHLPIGPAVACIFDPPGFSLHRLTHERLPHQ
jgi:hypothetical protein